MLIGRLGVQGATVAAAATNLAVGVAALLWAAREPASADFADPVTESPSAPLVLPPRARRLVWAAVFASGLLTMGYEVVWTRMLVFSLTSTVYSFTLILATFLTGLALGSRLFARLEGRADPLRTMGAFLFTAGLSALLLAPLAGRAPDLILGLSVRLGDTGAVFLAGSAAAVVAVLLLPATLMGLVLPLGMRLLVDHLSAVGRRAGAAYLVNTVGAVMGSLLAGFAFIPLLGLKGALVLLTVLQVALGLAFLLEAAPPNRRATLAAAAAVSRATLAGPNPFDSLSGEGEPTPAVVAHHDGVGASTTVVDYPGWGRVLRIDGFNAAADAADSRYMPMMTHVPLLLHPDPRRLLVICFGTGSTAGAGLLHPGVTVDVVDINPTVVRFASYFDS